MNAIEAGYGYSRLTEPGGRWDQRQGNLSERRRATREFVTKTRWVSLFCPTSYHDNAVSKDVAATRTLLSRQRRLTTLRLWFDGSSRIGGRMMTKRTKPKAAKAAEFR
jgi:hypothetical protein